MIDITRTVGLVLTALLVVSSSALVGAVDHGASNESGDWPAPRADEGRTGATVDAGPQPYGNASEFISGRTGGGSTSPARPIVVNGTAYLAHGGEDAPNGFVDAYDVETRESKWSQSNVGEPVGLPTVHDGSVYVATAGPESHEFPDSVNTSGLYSLDAATGEIEWRQNATLTEPLVAGGRVFTSLRDEGHDAPHRNVTALDPDTGERVWTADVHGKPAGYADGTLYVAENETNTVYALDPATGERRWQADVAEDAMLRESFAVTESVFVYGDGDATTYAHSAATGERLWERSVSSSLPRSQPDRISAPAVADGTVFLVSDDDVDRHSPEGQEVSAVHALEATTGESLWRFETSEELTGSPVVANGSVYVAGHATYALDADTGTEQWNLTNYLVALEWEDPSPVQLTAADGRLFVTETEHALPAVRQVNVVEPSETPPPADQRVDDDEPQFANKSPDAEIRRVTEPEDRFYYPANATVTLHASESADPDGNITEYRWYVDGELIGTGQTVNVTSSAEPCTSVEVRLEVTDDGGPENASRETGSDTENIHTGSE